MDPHQRFRQQVRGFYYWVLSLLLAGLGPIGGSALIETGTTSGRVAGAVVGTLTWLPMMIMIWLIIRAGDEFSRRVHLLAISLAFGGAMLLLMAAHWFTAAKLVDYVSYMELWIVIGIMWLVSMFIAKRYYERPR